MFDFCTIGNDNIPTTVKSYELHFHKAPSPNPHRKNNKEHTYLVIPNTDSNISKNRITEKCVLQCVFFNSKISLTSQALSFIGFEDLKISPTTVFTNTIPTVLFHRVTSIKQLKQGQNHYRVINVFTERTKGDKYERKMAFHANLFLFNLNTQCTQIERFMYAEIVLEILAVLEISW